MSKSPRIELKRGATFAPECQLKFDGEVVDITGWGIESDVKDRRDNVIASASVTITDAANGKFTLDFGGTDDWPGGTLVQDIRYAYNGTEFYSETVYISMLDAVTEVSS
jgi:hypothetical protein